MHRERTVPPSHVGKAAQDGHTGGRQSIVHADDVSCLDRYEDAVDGFLVSTLDELDARGVAVTEQAPTPATAVPTIRVCWPLVCDRPTEQLAVEVARGIELGRKSDNTQFHQPRVRSLTMKTLRRFLVALSLAGTIAGVLRMRGKGGVPPQEGGWREVSVPPK